MQKNLSYYINPKQYRLQRRRKYNYINFTILSTCKSYIKNYINRIVNKYTNIRHNYKRRSLAVLFFDYTRECPEEIINCQQLRDDYSQEYAKLKKYGMCTACKVMFLQEKVIRSFILK